MTFQKTVPCISDDGVVVSTQKFSKLDISMAGSIGIVEKSAGGIVINESFRVLCSGIGVVTEKLSDSVIAFQVGQAVQVA